MNVESSKGDDELFQLHYIPVWINRLIKRL